MGVLLRPFGRQQGKKRRQVNRGHGRKKFPPEVKTADILPQWKRGQKEGG